ncbi:hypothetical protein AV530_019111 [Patagioenas fasciata monilis]|uniref:Uncharacterized protein n=1 Tax=Patagioenas fasciata monilis TaxID=372326 RepID=A0A1V4KX77_PATFA|nr:hypothetical protein AV530_019111 [Patagioenas fasciata monilis]
MRKSFFMKFLIITVQSCLTRIQRDGNASSLVICSRAASIKLLQAHISPLSSLTQCSLNQQMKSHGKIGKIGERLRKPRDKTGFEAETIHFQCIKISPQIIAQGDFLNDH